MFNRIVLLLALVTAVTQLTAQDTLPRFSIQDLGQNRVRISWTNPYESCIQLNIQRSIDSLRNFRTIFSAQSPELPQNGYIDTKEGGNNRYYRIFYVLQGGNYFFSKPARTGQGFTNAPAKLGSTGMIRIRIKEQIVDSIPTSRYRSFRDSIIYHTKDSLFTISDQEIVVKRYAPPPAQVTWRPSFYLYTNREGNVIMQLPDVKNKNYRLIIYDTDGKVLFKVNRVKEAELMLDKADFLHAGWFSFDLHEGDRLVEHNKFYIPKAF